MGRSAETGSGHLWLLCDTNEIAASIFEGYKRYIRNVAALGLCKPSICFYRSIDEARASRERATSAASDVPNRLPWSSGTGGLLSSSIRDRSTSNATQRDRTSSMGQAKLER